MKKNVLCTAKAVTILLAQTASNKAYIEGFGYVAPSKTIVVDSDGDINKMVGTME
jgi:hypothetical protein